MRRLIIGSAVGLSLLASPFAARAQSAEQAPPPMQGPNGQGPNWQGPNGHGPNGGRSELHSIFAQLGLTADEKAALKQLRQQKSADEKAARHELREAKRAFAQAMTSESDETSLRAAHDALSKKREAFEGVRFEGLLAVRRVLTADQRKQFDTLYIQYKHNQNLQGAEKE